jgi:4-amino-4-deoxy-L-arabinose transferase-like glycosyltransferase
MVPGWDAVDIRHFINFLAFQVAILGFFFLARRILADGPALLAALLFAYQPVLFGHGFINQKDIPLLALFILAVLFGFRLVDRMGAANAGMAAMDVHDADRSFLGDFVVGWRSVGWRMRLAFLLLSIMGLLVSMDLVWGSVLLGTASSILTSAYRGEAWGPINGLFAAIAQDAHKTPLASYIDKVQVIFGWMRIVGSYAVFLPAFALGKRIVASGRGNRFPAPGVKWPLIASSLALGLAISVRPVGAMAGALVSLALLVRHGRKSLPLVASYWVVALSISYLTWPNLWEDPVNRFLQSLRLLAEFPAHAVLFRGVIHSSRELPWDYLPTLLGVQLTEPVLLLLIPGLFVASRALFKDARGQLFLLVACLWILLPFLGSVVFRLPLYDNFRQVLFALPPLFLIAGLAIDRAWSLARLPIARIALTGLLLSPGLAGIMELRPYEYVYYNQLIGGTNGAAGLFPHDYWCTSSREAMEWVNEAAPKGVRVAIYGPFDVAATFARPDLELAPSPPRRYRADYVLLCYSQSAVRARDLVKLPIAFVVMRSEVVLSIVLRTPGSGNLTP